MNIFNEGFSAMPKQNSNKEFVPKLFLKPTSRQQHRKISVDSYLYACDQCGQQNEIACSFCKLYEPGVEWGHLRANRKSEILEINSLDRANFLFMNGATAGKELRNTNQRITGEKSTGQLAHIPGQNRNKKIVKLSDSATELNIESCLHLIFRCL